MSTSSRLLPRDDLGVRADLVLDMPSGMVFAWVFAETVSREWLARTHEYLLQGPLSRAVKRSRVPGARDRWVKAAVAAELAYATEPIPKERVFAWIDEQDKAPLDLTRGPAWRLSATPVDGGGMVVVLLCHHAVADGLAVFAAWTAAVEGRVIGELPDEGGVLADIVDSARQWRAALVSIGSMIKSALRKSRGGKKDDAAPARKITTAADYQHELVASPTFAPRRVLLSFSTEQFRKAAAERGGTPNSLFVGIATRFLVSSGVIPDERTVNVSQRISDRAEGDVRGNITAGVDILVDVGPALYQDLRPIREASKAAFGEWEVGEDLSEFDSPLIQLLPDWLFTALTKQILKSPSKTLCTLSNVGKVPESMIRFGGASANALYPVFVLPKQLDAHLWRTTGSAVQGTMAELGGATVMVLEGRNPERHSVEHEAFVKLVLDECARWGLEPVQVL